MRVIDFANPWNSLFVTQNQLNHTDNTLQWMLRCSNGGDLSRGSRSHEKRLLCSEQRNHIYEYIASTNIYFYCARETLFNASSGQFITRMTFIEGQGQDIRIQKTIINRSDDSQHILWCNSIFRLIWPCVTFKRSRSRNVQSRPTANSMINIFLSIKTWFMFVSKPYLPVIESTIIRQWPFI